MEAQRIAVVSVFLGYAVVIGASLFEPTFPGLTGIAVLQLGSALALIGLVKTLTLFYAWHLVRLLPLGVLAVFALPAAPRVSWTALRTFATGLALAAAPLLIALCSRASALSQLVQTLAAVFALPLGVAAAIAWLGGPGARRLLVRRLVALAAFAVVMVGLVSLLGLEGAPRISQRPTISSEQRRLLVRNFRGRDPRKIPPGEMRSIVLSAQDFEQLVQWGADVAFRGRAEAALRPGGAAVSVSLPVPRTGRWLNVSAQAQAELEDGKLVFAEPRLEIGRLPIPASLAGWCAAFLLDRLQEDRDARRVLAGFKALSLNAEQAVLSYGMLDIPKRLAARLMWGEDAMGELHGAVSVYIARLLEVLPKSPRGDARFAQALTTTFALARERAKSGSLVSENRAALLALGVVLGHPKLVRFLGERLDGESLATINTLRDQTTLRGRADWSRHFTVSGALTVISAVAPSDAAGLLKEELDADGGSGFSFADLLADRCGTTLAQLATRSEPSAAGLQQQLAQGFAVDDFFPEAKDLPEGIPAPELSARYGGVGGAGFRVLMSDIERRVASCRGYRP